jgi:hypothetical protein
MSAVLLGWGLGEKTLHITPEFSLELNLIFNDQRMRQLSIHCRQTRI